MPTAGLYVHVPFCARKCLYCDFESVATLARIPDYLDAVEREARRRAREVDAVDTVYVGGGTPSVLGPARLARLLETLLATFAIRPGAEVTVELNPDDVTADLLAALEGAGVNRLSVGVQSFDDEALRALGRRHDAAGARRAIGLVRSRGFSNLSLDLMFGWRGQRAAAHRRDLVEALAFEPEHLSCYQLTVERGGKAPFAARLAAGDDPRASEAAQRRLFVATHETLTGRGYEHYEVSNFTRARPGFRSRHNERYWSHGPYLGLGPAAHSFDGARRRSWNAPSLDEYLEGRGGAETLDDEQLLLERLMLGFRTSRGVEEAALAAIPGWERGVERLVARGLCRREAGRLAPTVAGLLVADALPLELFELDRHGDAAPLTPRRAPRGSCGRARRA
jgi:oxygen-independent coproporphyrinogen-3 oxidase